MPDDAGSYDFLSPPPAPITPSMKIAPYTSPTGNTIPYWGSFMPGSGFDYDPSTTQMGQQFLDAIHKYDPNAKFVGETRGEGQPGNNYWSLQGDMSKIPGLGKGVDLNQGDFDPLYYSPRSSTGRTEQNFIDTQNHSFDSNSLYDPNWKWKDPILGQITSNRNVKPQGTSWLDIVGPALVGGFAGLASGGLGVIGSALTKAPQMINSIANGGFNPYALASAAVPFIPGLSGLPAQAIQQGLRYAGSNYKQG